MLSKRAVNVIGLMETVHPTSWDYDNFKYLTREKIVLDIWELKQAGHLKGCGAKTIDEIKEFHRSLNNIWE